MEAIILAGGQATRLGDAARGQPKALVPIAGHPLAEYQVSQLVRAGVDRVIVSCAAGQAGLFDVVAHPDYAKNGWIYFAFSDPQTRDGQPVSLTRIIRGKIRGNAVVDQEIGWLRAAGVSVTRSGGGCSPRAIASRSTSAPPGLPLTI